MPKNIFVDRVDSLFGALWGRRKPEVPKLEQATVPEGEVVYAIGDVHGMDTLLSEMLVRIAKDHAALHAFAHVVVLGDMIDRGPNAAGVIGKILSFADNGTPNRRVIGLKGNHEQMLLAFLENPEGVGPEWMGVGALPTLKSYGVPCGSNPDRRNWRRIRDALISSLPDSHLKLLRGLEVSFSCGDYFFSHAGARPGTPLNRQSSHDLMWYRIKNQDPTSYEKVVVHGHSPSESPYLSPTRINVDTGAYVTGCLTALRLMGDTREIFQVNTGTAPSALSRGISRR
jgi:serine/threonine protein phosphatase 1